MIERYNLFLHEFPRKASKEMQVFSIVSQGFFQPFSLMDNLLVILTALTAGAGLGFNRAMLFFNEGGHLRGKAWLGPGSPKEAETIWRVLSTSGIGYLEIIEHNRSLLARGDNPLTKRIKKVSYPINHRDSLIPARAVDTKEIVLVKDARNEPLVDRAFLDLIGVEEFLCIPLIAQEEVLGEIILDNAITRLPIEGRDIELASICGLLAANYIYLTNLQHRVVEMRKLAAMGEMAMFVTHQLRTPLVTIGGFADQLLEPKVDKAKQKRNLRIIRNEVRRLEKILLQLTQFLRVDIRKAVEVDVQEMIRLAVAAEKPKLTNGNVNIQTAVKSGVTAILCDPIHVGEALRNVIDNAIDAVVGGGTVRIEAARENDEWVVISVRDTGRGIPEAVKDKIFESFVSTKEKGIGLGLAYVKRVVDACCGRIEVDSQEGRGTTFRLYFRAKQPRKGSSQ
jgi:two-component system sensor histidine kinase HydH